MQYLVLGKFKLRLTLELLLVIVELVLVRCSGQLVVDGSKQTSSSSILLTPNTDKRGMIGRIMSVDVTHSRCLTLHAVSPQLASHDHEYIN